MALTKITPQMFDTSAAGHDFNIDNGTFVVDASTNRVGIGTATPSTLLDVNGALTATTIAGTLTTAAQTNITSVGTLTGLVVNGNASIQTGALTLSGANPPLSISNSGDAKVNFVRSSNTINYAMSSSASGGHGFYDNAASAYDLYMKAGNVGIGSTSPAAKLDVQIASAGIAQYVYNTGSNQAYINFANATTGKYTQAFGTPGGLLVGVDTDETSIVWNGSNTALRFGTNSTERMRIDSSGRVSFGPDAADIQIDPASTNSGNNLIYMRGNASNDKSSIQLNHYGVADYHIGVGHVGSGKFNIANDQTGNDFVIDTAGNVGIGTASPYSKLNVQGTSASTYTGSGPGTTIRASQGTDGNWIASDVDGKFAYFGVDGDNGKFAAYNYTSNAAMGVIIGQSTFKVVSEQAGIIQSDGDYLAKLHSAGADGYLSLYIGTATPTLKTKISSYGTSFFNSTTGQTAANQALVSIGAQTGKKAGYLNIDSAATSTSGGIRHRMSHGTQYLNVAATHTGSGSLPYWHIKTSIYYNQNIMFVARVHGYAYGNAGHIVDMQRSGYAYNGSSTSLVGSQFVNNGSFSSATLECYYTGSGQLCFRAYAGASSYYTGWAFDIKMQSPTGYNHDFVVVDHTMNATSGNYYT